MNYRSILAPILAAALVSCSGSKQSADNSLFPQSKTNVSVDTRPVKIQGNDKSAKATVLGEDVPLKKKSKMVPTQKTRQFLNGDFCKSCEYISRIENEKGNLVEAEVTNGYQNGEEREYHNGELIRSSYYFEGGRNGMEYFYSGGKIVDSVYAETKPGNVWQNESADVIPGAIYDYLGYLFLGKEEPGFFAYTTQNGLVSTIYRKDATDTTAGTPIVATLEYKDHRDTSNFKLTIRKPFYEEMTFKDNELVYRKKRKGNGTILEFKKGEFLKDFYDNGKIKRTMVGDISSKAENSSEICTSCRLQTFFENGLQKSDVFFENSKIQRLKTWNKKGILITECTIHKYAKWFLDDGTPQMEWQGDITEDFEFVNGTNIIFHPSGKIDREEKYEDGKIISRKQWSESGKLELEFFQSKFAKTYYGNGQLYYQYDGDVSMEGNSKILLHNGTGKAWSKQGILESSIVFSNDTLVEQQSWDSTGALIVNYKRGQYIIWNNKPMPGMRTELLGNIIFENGNITSTGKTIERDYRGEKLVSEHYNEEHIPSLKTYKKTTTYAYDSTGHKTLEKVYHFGTVITDKEWEKDSLQKDYFLCFDFNANSHLNLYYEPKKLLKTYKGTSDYIEDSNKKFKEIKHINGTGTYYHANGKKAAVKVWKNRVCVSTKIWTEDGTLYIDFDANKYLKFYSDKTKKITMDFKGTSKILDDGSFDLIDGVAKSFDETGKPTITETYKDGHIVDTQETLP